MKRILMVILIIFCSGKIWAINDDYPKSKQERQADDIGSIAGEEGITFRPGKIKNESTKAIISPGVNKYLWQASIEILDTAPLASVDSPTGIIITDWYESDDKLGYNIKVNIIIKDDVIDPSAIEVKVFERVKKNNKWVGQTDQTKLASNFEEKIIRRAREIYIKENR